MDYEFDEFYGYEDDPYEEINEYYDSLPAHQYTLSYVGKYFDGIEPSIIDKDGREHYSVDFDYWDDVIAVYNSMESTPEFDARIDDNIHGVTLYKGEWY